jgi:hypothetical protein
VGRTGDLGVLIVSALNVAAVGESCVVRVVLELIDVARALLAVHNVAHALDHLKPLLEADVAGLEPELKRFGQITERVDVGEIGEREVARRDVVL